MLTRKSLLDTLQPSDRALEGNLLLWTAGQQSTYSQVLNQTITIQAGESWPFSATGGSWPGRGTMLCTRCGSLRNKFFQRPRQGK